MLEEGGKTGDRHTYSKKKLHPPVPFILCLYGGIFVLTMAKYGSGDSGETFHIKI